MLPSDLNIYPIRPPLDYNPELHIPDNPLDGVAWSDLMPSENVYDPFNP